MFQTIKNGGILMVPIIMCGLASLFIIIERLYYFINVKKRDQKFEEDICGALDKRDYSAAESACILADTPCADVVRTALSYRNLNETDLKESVQTKMDSVVPKFEHLLTALGTIGNISTLLGLLGTVTGNIKAFGVLGNGGSMGDPALLANAIAEALVTTVGGLTVSIPSIIFHNYFNSQVNHKIRDMESLVTKVIFKLTGKAPV